VRLKKDQKCDRFTRKDGDSIPTEMDFKFRKINNVIIPLF
jgi:hypothetical protein